MRPIRAFLRRSLSSCAFLMFAFALWADPAIAQVQEVVVGITPTCPYGIKGCWAGAYEALGRIDGVQSVAKTPDAYNCTASLNLKSQTLPDPDAWAATFKTIVDKAYVFRGVELTVDGTVEKAGDGLALRVPGITQPIALASLRNKLQWNFKKSAARQPEPDERDAMSQLALKAKDVGNAPFQVQVTGPFKKTDHGYVLEVREFTHSNPG
jgi:galactose oxidase